jgi:hypothetical protein
MKSLIALGVAAATIALPANASAQTRVMQDHAATAKALACLLDHDHGQKQEGCKGVFVGSATGPSQFWLWWTPTKDLDLGPLVSSNYAGTQQVNAYITNRLNGRPADVYDVRFEHMKKTFYIVPPRPDGKIEYLHVRSGDPDDEKLYSAF